MCVGAVTIAAPQVGRERPPRVHEAASGPEAPGLELGGGLLKRALSGGNRKGVVLGRTHVLVLPAPHTARTVHLFHIPPPYLDPAEASLTDHPPLASRAHVSARMTFPLNVPLHPT